MLKACVNGARQRADHPALPVTAMEIAQDVAAVVAAGASAVHLHVKDAQGADTLDGDAMARVLTEVRHVSPSVPLGVTTGAWAQSDPNQRVAAIRSWGQLPAKPDFASVNWHEAGADQVAAELLEIGVGVEAGLWHAKGARAWLASQHRDRCSRVLLELPDGLDATALEAEVAHLRRMIEDVGSGETAGFPVVLHGEDGTAWPALRLASRSGLSTRIGFEDILTLPDGSVAADNAALVHAAQDLLARAS